MLSIQICMDITERHLLLKQSTIGGGKLIEFSINWNLHDITPVNLSISFQKQNYSMFYYYFAGLVLFLEEDHYVSEDFLYLLKLMQSKGHEICPKCNILSLGSYLKTFNYYTFNHNNKVRLIYYCS